MSVVNAVLNGIFSVVFWPLQLINPTLGLLIVSVIAGIILLIMWGKTSNQNAIKAAKDRIAAHLLEVRLYNEDLALVSGAMGRVFKYLAIYQRYVFKPLVIVLVPVLIMLIQLNFRYGYGLPQPGETMLVKAVLKPGANLDLELDIPEGLALETPGVRIAKNQDLVPEVDWRIRVDQPGDYTLTFRDPKTGSTTEKSLVADGDLPIVSPLRTSPGFLDELLYPMESPIPADSPLQSVEIGYEMVDLPLLGISMNWVIIFFVVSVLAGFALKGVFNVEI